MDNLKENKILLTKKTVKEIPQKWIILKQYKGNFYTYKPSDFLSHFKICITDTAFIEYTGEGPVANNFFDLIKVNDSTFKLKVAGINSKDRDFIIHIIDKKNGIAVFEQISNVNEKIFYLMISANKIRNLPIIVNYCETQKQSEFHFNKPDFEILLKKICKRASTKKKESNKSPVI